MKKLFNNPWVITCLGLFSLGYLGFSIAGPLMSEEAHAFEPVVMDMPAMPGNPDELLSFNNDATIHNLDKANITWLEDLDRDPFGANAGTHGAVGRREPIPHLDAIFSGETTHMAVVDAQLVREGDKIRDYRVVAIKRTEVILVRNGKQLTLDAQ